MRRQTPPALGGAVTPRASNFLLPPLHNLRHTPKSTEGINESARFTVTISVNEKKQLDPRGTLSAVLMAKEPRPTGYDLVIQMKVTGLSHPEDRIRVASALGKVWYDEIAGYYPRTESPISQTGMMQTNNTCNPPASSTTMYWYSYNERSTFNAKEMLKKNSRGSDDPTYGIFGLVTKIFGKPKISGKPGAGLTTIESAEGQALVDRFTYTWVGKEGFAKDNEESLNHSRTIEFERAQKSILVQSEGGAGKKRRASKAPVADPNAQRPGKEPRSGAGSSSDPMEVDGA